MKLSKRGEYALRSLINLGIAAKVGRSLVRVTELAKAEDLPVKFLEQVMQQLREAGFVESERGKHGGYRLAKPASQIHIGAIVRLVDGTLAPIVARPADARVPAAVAHRLQRLASRLPVAVVSGRRVQDVRPRLLFTPWPSVGNQTLWNTSIGWRMTNPRLPKHWTISNGESAEKIAREQGISRQAQDEFAVRSHRLAAKAWADGVYDGEIVQVPGAELARDEGIRDDTSVEKLAGLKALFAADGEGSVTAGNSSPINDVVSDHRVSTAVCLDAMRAR